MLTSQGADAPGGARNYIIDGKMTGGVELVACPVIYRDSGVMTFIVNQDGQIYQKDLGPNRPDSQRDDCIQSGCDLAAGDQSNSRRQ
jgi:hypothetical protein